MIRDGQGKHAAASTAPDDIIECRRACHPALEVELRDGSGAVTLVWLGRRQIPGIDCGQTLKVWGRISCHEGRRLVYNPRYELMQTPAAS